MSYAAYLSAQVEKTTRLRGLHNPRVPSLVQWWSKSTHLRGLRVLSVGCRNRFELDVLRMFHMKPIGIDLVAFDPEVIPMDMHQLGFRDRSMDAVFSCHSLEHAYDPEQVWNEWARVTKPGGWWVIEVPIRYETTEVDRQDWGSSACLAESLGPYLRVVSHVESKSGLIARVKGWMR